MSRAHAQPTPLKGPPRVPQGLFWGTALTWECPFEDSIFARTSDRPLTAGRFSIWPPTKAMRRGGRGPARLVPSLACSWNAVGTFGNPLLDLIHMSANPLWRISLEIHRVDPCQAMHTFQDVLDDQFQSQLDHVGALRGDVSAERLSWRGPAGQGRGACQLFMGQAAKCPCWQQPFRTYASCLVNSVSQHVQAFVLE